MNLVSENMQDALLVTTEDTRIDAAVAIRFKDQMRAITDDGPKRVVLDLQNVQFVDSSGLGAIVAAMKQVGSGRRLELAGLTSSVKKVFALTRMDSVFTIHGSVEDAFGHTTAKAS